MRPAPNVPTVIPSTSYERSTQSAMFQAAFDHPLIGRDVIAHQRENHHDDVFGDTDAVAISDFRNGGRYAFHRGLQINAWSEPMPAVI